MCSGSGAVLATGYFLPALQAETHNGYHQNAQNITAGAMRRHFLAQRACADMPDSWKSTPNQDSRGLQNEFDRSGSFRGGLILP
jgi:hypothetical protein